MNNKLNEEYFKTREKHKNSTNGYTKYVIWVFLCLVIIFVINFVISSKEEKDDKMLNKMMMEQQVDLNENIQKEDKIVKFHKGVYSIKILQGYSYVEVGENAPLIILSSDSGEASVLVQIMPEKVNVKDFISDFRNKVPSYNTVGEIISKDYKNGNLMESCDVEFTKNDINYFGTLIIFNKAEKCVLIQGTSKKKYWDNKVDEIYEMIDSFFTLNN